MQSPEQNAPGAVNNDPYGVPGGSYAPPPASYPAAQAPLPDPGYDPIPSHEPAPISNSSYGQGGGIVPHTVQKGETLWSISRQYGTTVGAIQSANGISGETIIAGTTLNIPKG